ncbi:MAG TPA: hypothetical protein DCS09_11125 [Porphyromonadaceae bacterium]|nr:hypothetical protein [Porphyromonadaceae bacterium]
MLPTLEKGDIMKKALITMHSVYKSTHNLLSFAWAAGLAGYSLRITVEVEKPVVEDERGLVAAAAGEMVKI